MRAPRLSIVLATHNRLAALAHTLDRLADLQLERGACEIIVVDNASDEDVASVTRGRRDVELLRLKRNTGPCGKAFGVDRARGAVLLFLDDDSSPRAGSIERLLQRFDEDGGLGAAGFTVHLPDGSQECCALPHVFVGCGVGLRAEALRAVGGLDRSLFMQAEEYDVSFRLLQAGWKVEIFGDLAVEHLKTPRARRPQRTTYYDAVNNCRVAARYLPEPYYGVYRQDWLARYRQLAEAHGHQRAFRRGWRVGRLRGLVERPLYRRWRLSAPVLEQVFSWSYVAARMTELRAAGLRRVVLVDYGKNIYAFYRGARRAGLEILAVGDPAQAPAGDHGPASRAAYRDVPLVPPAEAVRLPADAYVISTTSYVYATQRQAELTGRTRAPVLNWFPAPGSIAEPGGRVGLAPVAV